MIDQDGLRSDGWYLTGNIQASKSEYGQALLAYDRAIPKSGFPERVSYRIGITLSKMGKVHEAKDALKAAIQLEQYVDEIGCLHSVLDFPPEDNARAVERFDQYSRNSPGSMEMLYLKGLAHAKEGHYQIGIDCSSKIISIKPKLLKAWRLNGCSLYLSDRFQDAAKSFDSYVGLEDFISWQGAAMTYFETGHYEKAIEFFDKVIAVEPKNKRALEYKARALEKLGRVEEAKNWYDRAGEIQSMTNTNGFSDE